MLKARVVDPYYRYFNLDPAYRLNLVSDSDPNPDVDPGLKRTFPIKY
jgi:hypothetical protein